MSLTPSLDPDPESDLDPDLDPESDLAAPEQPTNHLSIKTLMRKNKQTKVNFHSSVNHTDESDTSDATVQRMKYAYLYITHTL